MNILIIDDHPLTCAGLAALLEANVAGARARSVHRANEALALLRETGAWDWVFLDLRLPDDPTGRVFARLSEADWAPHAILMSAEAQPARIRQGLAAGMRGFIAKSESAALVLQAFAQIRAGQQTVPEPQVPPGALPPQQQRVLALVLKGFPNKRIAADLAISVNTVKEYVSALLQHFGASNRLDLVLKLGEDRDADVGASALRNSIPAKTERQTDR